MIQSVIKRDGRIVEYDAAKIATAIGKAFSSCGISDTALTDDIAKAASEHFDDNVNVEQIQDFVVQSLLDAGQNEVAEAYEAYRQERSIARQSETKRIFDDIINIKANDVTRENANMNADTPSGMMMKFASESTKPFADAYLLSADVKKALHANLIHIHDKDFYVTKSLTCVQHPSNTILQHGFKAAHAESRPARRIETASVQACISLETAQNEMHTLNCAA